MAGFISGFIFIVVGFMFIVAVMRVFVFREMTEKDIEKMSDDKKRFAIKCLSELKRPIFRDEFEKLYSAYRQENSRAAQEKMDLEKSRKMIAFINRSLPRGDTGE